MSTWNVYSTNFTSVLSTRWNENGVMEGSTKVVKQCDTLEDADRQANLMQQEYDRVRAIAARAAGV